MSSHCSWQIIFGTHTQAAHKTHDFYVKEKYTVGNNNNKNNNNVACSEATCNQIVKIVDTCTVYTL